MVLPAGSCASRLGLDSAVSFARVGRASFVEICRVTRCTSTYSVHVPEPAVAGWGCQAHVQGEKPAGNNWGMGKESDN